MPIYEYACESCGHHLEVMQRLSEEPITFCPNCHKESLIRLISAAGFRLKGGGWYETDFKDNAKRKNLVGDNESSSSTRPIEGSQASSGATETKETKASSSEASKNEPQKSTSNSANTDTTKKGSNGTSGTSGASGTSSNSTAT